MKRTRKLIVAGVVLMLLMPVAALSQTRRRSSGQPQRRAPSSSTTTAANAPKASADARAAGASRVAEQIKLLSRFLYLYGRVSNGFDVAAEAASRDETSTAATQKTEQSKVVVRQSLRDFREGLDNLEISFRTTPELQRYYTRLAGVAAGAADAEAQAAANQYEPAGRALIGVVNRLTDVLLEMR
ncbi:MAG: hypothetical protein ABR577_16120 [Pyrinomonadaceae bacterium]